jgi:hypothetical protein
MRFNWTGPMLAPFLAPAMFGAAFGALQDDRKLLGFYSAGPANRLLKKSRV